MGGIGVGVGGRRDLCEVDPPVRRNLGDVLIILAVGFVPEHQVGRRPRPVPDHQVRRRQLPIQRISAPDARVWICMYECACAQCVYTNDRKYCEDTDNRDDSCGCLDNAARISNQTGSCGRYA